MKLISKIVLLSTLLGNGISFAGSSIQLEVGPMLNASGGSATSGTWAVIVNSNSTNILPGGLNTSGNNILTSGSLASGAFANKTLSVGLAIDGDIIVGVGSIGDLGDDIFAGGIVSFADGQESLNYAFYWFPNQSTVISSNFEVGGYFQKTASAGLLSGMVSPPSPFTGQPASFDVSAFNAITVPEPSSLALTALGVTALLRRRRN